MQVSALPALWISLAALAISVYGVAERRGAARRAERIRFATLIDELNKLRVEHSQPTTILQYDALTYAINETGELLAMQAFGMTRRWLLRRAVISPEYRTLAYALSRAGYRKEAERTWREASRAARREGAMPLLYARRGFAYFLFGEARVNEGRAEMESALDAIGSADDTARVHQIKTLKYWSNAELRADDAGPEEAAALVKRAERLLASLGTEHARRQMREFLARTDLDE